MKNDTLPVDRTQQEILSERKKRIFSKKTLILLLLSFIILYFLIKSIDLTKAESMLGKADIKLLPAAFLLYLFSNFFKTLRFMVFFKDHHLKIKTLFIIVSFHNFFNLILPARTGELTFVYYLNKIASIDITKGIHSLLLVRIYDLVIVSLFFIISLLLYFGMDSTPQLLLLGIVFSLFSVLLIFKLGYVIKISNIIIQKFFNFIKVDEKPFIVKLKGKLHELIDEFEKFDTMGNIPLLSITSMFIWVSLYLLSFTTIKIFSLPVNLLQSVIGSTGAVLTNVLPINSFGSFGTLEAGWTGGFVIIGMSANDAIISGFGYHIIALVSSALVASFCFVFYKLKKLK